MILSLRLRKASFFLIFSLIVSALSGQEITKPWTFQRARQTLKNKVKKDLHALQQAENLEKLRSLQQQSEISTPTIQLREADLGISVTDEETESEIHAAINPVDTNNIIVAAMKFGEGFLGPELTFPIYYTDDFGESWKLSQFNGVNDQLALQIVAGGGDPIIVFDSEGTAYLSWLTVTLDLSFEIKISLNWAVSRDGGATWTRQPEPIDGGTLEGDLENPMGRFVDKEWLAVDESDSPYRDNIYIAYAEIDFQDTSYQILVRRKEAGSDTLAGEVVQVLPDDFVFAQFTSIDVDNQGRVHLMFAGGRLQDTEVSLFHSRSDDGGRTFSTPQVISAMHMPCFPPGLPNESDCPVVGIDSTRMYPCPHLRVDNSGGLNDGTLYAVWTADGTKVAETAGMDIYYSRSTDGGSSWSPPIVLNDDLDPANHQFFPSLSVNDGGAVVVTWYDRREDTANVATKYYMTYSDDGGLTFQPNFAVSREASDFEMIGSANANFGVGEYTQVVTTGYYALPFWADGRTNDGNIEIFTAKIPLQGNVTTDIPTIETVTDRFSIYGPYPNPARDQLHMKLFLKAASEVAIHLFDIRGRLVKTLHQGNFPDGEHMLELPVEGLAVGTYALMVQTEFGIRTRRIQIVD
jgi:hypothetical protein